MVSLTRGSRFIVLDLGSLKRFREKRLEIFQLIPKWATVYEVDESMIMKQIEWAHVWCDANPKRAPKKDPIRFLGNWMRIARQMGTLVRRKPAFYVESKPSENEIMTGEDWAKMREVINQKENHG